MAPQPPRQPAFRIESPVARQQMREAWTRRQIARIRAGVDAQFRANTQLYLNAIRASNQAMAAATDVTHANLFQTVMDATSVFASLPAVVAAAQRIWETEEDLGTDWNHGPQSAWITRYLHLRTLMMTYARQASQGWAYPPAFLALVQQTGDALDLLIEVLRDAYDDVFAVAVRQLDRIPFPPELR